MRSLIAPVLLFAMCLSLLPVDVSAQNQPDNTSPPALWLVDDNSGSRLQRLYDGARITLSTYRGASLNVAAQASSAFDAVHFRSSDGYSRSTTRRPFLLFSRHRPLDRGALRQGGTLKVSVKTCIGTCRRGSASSLQDSVTVTFIPEANINPPINVPPSPTSLNSPTKALASPTPLNSPTNALPRPTPYIPVAIPGMSNWEQKMVTDGRNHCAALVNGSKQGQSLLANTYYDAQRVFQQIRDYTGDSSWQGCVDAAERQYRDLYVVPNSGMIPAYWNFSSGMTHDFIETRDSISYDTVGLLANNAAFAPDPTPIENLQDWEYSRETALTMLTYLEAEKAGYPRRARLLLLANTALDHLQQWFVTREAKYVKSFMVGITMNALIEYYNSTGDVRVIPAITTALDGLWALNWVESSRAFKYSDVQNRGDEPTTPAPDLNQIIAPAFAWMYFQTGKIRFRDRGDKIFQGGVDLGYSAGAKQFNQLYRWSFDYVRWRSLKPLR